VIGHHTKVAIHSLSLSAYAVVMSQSSNNRVIIVPRVRRVYCPNCHVLVNWNRAATQLENLHHMFYKCPYFLVSILSYTCIFMFALVECKVVCSQSCVLGSRLPVLPMKEHDGADSTYFCSYFASYNCSSCS
jgi:hypothetical protein